MWLPFKRKEKKEKFDSFTINPGQMVGFKFETLWDRKKNEVILMTNDGPKVLNENSKLILCVTVDDANPLKLEIVPDFKNKMLNIVEILDPDAKINENKVVLKFDRSENRIDLIKNVSIDELKKIRTRLKNSILASKLIMLLGLFIVFYDLHIFFEKNNYIYLIISILMLILVIAIYRTHIKLKKIYDDIKDMNEIDLVKKM